MTVELKICALWVLLWTPCYSLSLWMLVWFGKELLWPIVWYQAGSLEDHRETSCWPTPGSVSETFGMQVIYRCANDAFGNIGQRLRPLLNYLGGTEANKPFLQAGCRLTTGHEFDTAVDLRWLCAASALVSPKCKLSNFPLHAGSLIKAVPFRKR
jgi:hypothetical protein